MKRRFYYKWKRKRQIRNFLIIVAIIVGIILFFKYVDIEIQEPQTYTSIKDVVQNSENYFDKNITIKGKLRRTAGGYGLSDSEGYWIKLGDDAIGKKGHRHRL